nr:hypothetical protein [Corynebacterium ulcerans]
MNSLLLILLTFLLLHAALGGSVAFGLTPNGAKRRDETHGSED